jgi:NOL1/NOP2/fmu family ribosome biogenesis protein
VGNTLHWRYVLDAKREGGGTIHLDMDDWMWLIDDKTLVNKTSFSKFGIQFGEVTIFFRKR